MVAQAYSLWKANKYQVWHSTMAEAGAPEPEIVVEPDDRARILKNMTNLYRECSQWEHYFRRTRAEVTSVS
jgi:LPS sulfotransferase NodH